MKYLAIGLMTLALAASGIGEGLICVKALDGMSRNPEMYGKLRSSMIIGAALVETCGIYALLVAILLIFVLLLLFLQFFHYLLNLLKKDEISSLNHLLNYILTPIALLHVNEMISHFDL